MVSAKLSVFLFAICCLELASCTIECYDCIGKTGPSSDSCYRGSDSERKVQCHGRCGKFSFWATVGDSSGMVRRGCVDRPMSCEQFGEIVTSRIDQHLMVPKNARLSLKYKCDFCNTTLCNEAAFSYPSLTSFLILSVLTVIFGN